MNYGNLAAALIQVTNIVLILKNSNADIRKFVAWRIDKEEPEEVLTGLQISNVGLEDSLKIFEHPLETGATITDHIIQEPNQVSITAYISNDDAQTQKELEYLAINAIPLKIRAQNKIIPRAIIKDKPFSFDSAHFDKTPFNIVFREEQEVSPVYVAMPPRKVRKKSNSSRVKTGVKQAQPEKKKSWAKSLIAGGRT